MKCFNHPEREAVATCQRCGKGLCRECAEKYTPCLCDECAAQMRKNQQQAQSQENIRKAKYKAALINTRSRFIRTAVIGAVIGLVMVLIVANGYGYSDFMQYVLLFGEGFCFPFGWSLLTYLESFSPVIYIVTPWFMFVINVIKFFVSIIIGLPAMLYQAYKAFTSQQEINKMKIMQLKNVDISMFLRLTTPQNSYILA